MTSDPFIRVADLPPSPPPTRWGTWRLSGQYLIGTAGGYDYSIDLHGCTSSARVLDWCCQIAGKTWGTPLVVGDLVHAFNDVLNARHAMFGRPGQADDHRADTKPDHRLPAPGAEQVCMTNDEHDRIRRMMAEQGAVPYVDDELGVGPAHSHFTAQLGDDLTDTRGEDIVCALCSGKMHRQRRVRLTDIEYAHPLCASLPQPDPIIVPKWLQISRRTRLALHIMCWQIDPRTEQVSDDAHVEFTDFYETSDGGPFAVTPQTYRGKMPAVGMPNCWWSFRRGRPEVGRLGGK